MTTLYLRFETAAEALAAFSAHGMTTTDQDGAEHIAQTGCIGETRFDTDILFGTGTIYRPTGETIADEQGNTIPLTAPLPGYHINVLWWGDNPPDFGAADMAPAHPACVFS